MAFPGTVDPLARALLTAQDTARTVKTQASSASAAMAAGDVSGNVIIEIYVALVAAKTKFDAVAAVSGIGRYAKDQFADQGFDVVAAFTAMTDAITDCGTWINTNFPKDGNGYLLKDKLTASGVDVRAFTTAQTAGLRTVLNALIATIE